MIPEACAFEQLVNAPACVGPLSSKAHARGVRLPARILIDECQPAPFRWLRAGTMTRLQYRWFPRACIYRLHRLRGAGVHPTFLGGFFSFNRCTPHRNY